MEELEIPSEPANPEIEETEPAAAPRTISMEEWLGGMDPETPPVTASQEDSYLSAVLEAIIYVTEEPLTVAQAAAALAQSPERIGAILDRLVAEFDKPEHGLCIREVAGGFKMATKAEHHDAVRNFVKSLKPPLKLSLPALETLAVIAYKQPVTSPEIMEIRGVQGTGVLKTLIDRKLIATAGRKNVIGKPILYKTTKEFMLQFGLKDLSELPSLKEFEEIRRMAIADADSPAEPAPEIAPETESQTALVVVPEIAGPAAEPGAPSSEPPAVAQEPGNSGGLAAVESPTDEREPGESGGLAAIDSPAGEQEN
jgi:segregation and condensation protein B